MGGVAPLTKIVVHIATQTYLVSIVSTLEVIPVGAQSQLEELFLSWLITQARTHSHVVFTTQREPPPILGTSLLSPSVCSYLSPTLSNVTHHTKSV